MKTLNEQIERLRELVRKCYGAVAGKNGTVPEVGERNMENLPAAIVSIKSASEVPKVKVSTFKVSSACINADGIWESGELVDFSVITSYSGLFYGNTAIKILDISNLVHPKITSLENMFRDCFNLEEINTSDWDTSNVTTLYHTFYRLRALKKLDVSNFDTRKVISMYFTFADCSSLTELDISNWDVSNVTNMDGCFEHIGVAELNISNWDVSNVTSMNRALGNLVKVHSLDLTNWNISNVTNIGAFPLVDLGRYSGYDEVSFVGGRTIDYIISNNVTALKGLKVHCNFSYDNRQRYDRASLRALINGLADLTGETPQTLALGSKLMVKLTEEDIAIATSKNWTITG